MPKKLNGRWALEWECCRECGTTRRDHAAFGYCDPCYQKLFLKEKRTQYYRDRWKNDPKFRQRRIKANHKWFKKQSKEFRQQTYRERFLAYHARYVAVPDMAIKRALVSGKRHKSRKGHKPGDELVYDLVTAGGIVEAPLSKMVILQWPDRTKRKSPTGNFNPSQNSQEASGISCAA